MSARATWSVEYRGVYVGAPHMVIRRPRALDEVESGSMDADDDRNVWDGAHMPTREEALAIAALGQAADNY